MSSNRKIGEVTRLRRQKRRQILIYRGMLLVAAGGLMLSGGLATAGLAALTLVLAFGWSNLLLGFVPSRSVSSLRFTLGLGAADLLLVGLGVHLAGAGSGFLPVSSLLMVLVVALGDNRIKAVAGATTVTAMHAWFVMHEGVSAAITQQLALQVFFLLSVGLYYGFLVEGVHKARKAAQLEKLSKKELAALLEILETITGSDNLEHVPRAIVSRIGRVVPSLRCSLIRVDVDRGNCEVLASHDDPELQGLVVRLEKYPEVREAIWSRRPVFVRDVGTDSLMADVRQHVAPLGFSSIIVVPMVVDDPDLGTLLLKANRFEEEFRESEISFCEAVGRAVVNTMHAAVLRRGLMEQTERRRSVTDQLRCLMEYSPGPILRTRLSGRITDFNQAASRLLGWSRTQVTGEKADVLFPDGGDETLIRRVEEQGSVRQAEAVMRHREGREVHVEISAAAVRGEDGSGAILWMGQDLTPLRAAQLKLLQAEKMSTIGSVISGVAHELNNPLSVVLGFSDLLLARRSGTDDEPHLGKINEAAVRCQRIVRNLLAYARAHEPEKRYLQLNEVLEKTLELKEYQLRVHNIEIVKELSPDLPRTMLDFHQFQQVFLNLMNNAQHAMEAVPDRQGRLVIRSWSEEGMVKVELRDNGQGFTGEAAKRLFEPFFTTKEEGKGTGLGLSVSSDIVRGHGGRIRAEANPGGGAGFIIEIPIQGEPAEAASPPAERKPEPAKGEPSPATRDQGAYTILVVDDEPTIVELLNLLLEEAGHKVDTASDGEQAWKMAQEHDYDLVITDVRMPRMNGLELYKKIKSMRPSLAENLIFVSGDLGDNATARFLAEVNATIIPKPVEVLKFVDTVEEALKHAGAGSVH